MSEAVNIPQLRFSEFSGEWEKNIFKNIVKLQRGSSPRPIVKYVTTSKDGVNWIKIGDIVSEKNFIDSTKEKITQEGAKKSRKVSVGEIILSNSMSYGKPIILNIDGYIHDGWFVIRGFENSFDKSYLLQVLGSEWIQKQYKRLAAGGVVNNISSELVNSVKINLPIKPEQQKIAAFLSAVDNKIEQLSKKQALLGEYKKGVMQQIFSQAIRFKADDGGEFPEWEEKKLGKYLTHKSKKNKGAKVDLVLSVSNKKGFITQDEQFDGYQVASKDLTNYKIVEKGEYAYNPSRINVGSIARLKNSAIGIVSPMYVIFKLKSLEPVFFDNLYQTHLFKHLIKVGCSGSVRDSLNFNDMADFVFNFPSLEEQTKIANFLSSIDSKIEQVGKQFDESKQFKKALLQQMFV